MSSSNVSPRLGPLQVGPYELPARAFLAPMSGVSDLPFRRIAARFGAGLVISEMVACESFVKGDAETQMRAEAQADGLHVVQLAGREARFMGEAAKVVAGAGAQIIDINMGCPAKKVTSGYSGSALMRDLDHALTLIDATVAAVDVPVTVKMRLGWDETSLNAADLARRAEAAGVQMVTVHGRTRQQFYKGDANWDAIAGIKQAVSIPVVANGDCRSSADAVEMLRRSGADAVMIGRGAYGRPWLPGTVSRFLATGQEGEAPQGADFAALVAEHYEDILQHYGTHAGLRIARKHLGWYLEVAPAGSAEDPAFRRALLTSSNPQEVLGLLGSWFSALETRSAA
ncbi:tRNA dihydrouridine synthase DusB [Roseibium aestuarii]|uniref:tRNA-dihydrouridine synthase n=1 Tax=Roseibium aestuarii TaxID=2600299 RepID=A0ABW4JR33_9HYPH|nr:tRNA dihydrouridine synthase DusB [Roseibium aestuarii]